ncbi:MAG: hypothetical protein KC609_09140 [Myxococcales bacterium]|nr:hypothetical protein [Myxococcales bacterium]
MKRSRRQTMTSVMAAMLLAALAMACGTKSGPSTGAGCTGDSLTVGAESLCVATQAIQETGFQCPPGLANLTTYGQLKICSKTPYLPPGTNEKLKQTYPPTALPPTGCDAIPTCKSGHTPVSSVSGCTDGAPCYEVTLCGATIICAGSEVNCLAYPVCANGETEVENEASCPSESTCSPVSICGVTIWCASPKTTCTAAPTCKPGETQVADSSQCLQDDAVCYQASICGTSIWCTGPAAPKSCPSGEVQISADDCVVDDNSCYQLSGSGEAPLWCAKNRELASGMCVKNAGDACTKDSDCTNGGCGGELCYNPSLGEGISTCECTTPGGVSCGCVNGTCAWWGAK